MDAAGLQRFCEHWLKDYVSCFRLILKPKLKPQMYFLEEEDDW